MKMFLYMVAVIFTVGVFSSPATAQWVAIAGGGAETASVYGPTLTAVKKAVLKKCPDCARAWGKTSAFLAVVQCPYNKEGDTYNWGGYSKKSIADAKKKAIRVYKRTANSVGYIIREKQCIVSISFGGGKVHSKK